MRRFALLLEPEQGVPVYLGIARALSAAVRQGRLRPGEALPGSRALASALGVNRNTVIAALRELEAEGFVTTEPGRGTFVSAELPDVGPARAARAATIAARVAFELRGQRASPRGVAHAEASMRGPPARGVLSPVGGLPDLRLVPWLELARAQRRALEAATGRAGAVLLGYGDPRGDQQLREALAEMLRARRAVPVDASNLLVTRGSQMGLHLVASALIEPGDVVAVEAFGYLPAFETLERAGARLVPVAVDDQGIDVDAIAALARRTTLRAVYVTPHHQYPTTVALSKARRLALLSLARSQRFAVIEDDYDHEFHYEGRPLVPLLGEDPTGVVVHVGTLSKIMAPGLRLGFVAAPTSLIERLAALRFFIDRQGDLAGERAMADLIESGALQRHARRMLRVYAERREAMRESLERHLGGVLTFELPPGGMAIWACAAPRIDVEAWAARALERGVVLHTEARFAFDGRPGPHVRLGFAALTPREIDEAARRLASALPRPRQQR